MHLNFRFNVLTFSFFAVAIAFCLGPHSVYAAQFAISHAQNIMADPGSLGLGLALGGMFMGDIAPFPTRPELLAVKMAYKNPMLIADLVMPRVRVNRREYEYIYYEKGDTFRIPDTKIGRDSAPNRVQLKAKSTTGLCDAYGLDYPVPQDDIDEAPAGYDPLAVGVASIANWVALDREVRVAALAFAAGTYAAGNKIALTGNDRWDVDHADSDPIADIMTGLDACVIRPNYMVIGRAAYSKLCVHDHIIKALKSDTGVGIANRKEIANLFELQDIYVGESFFNAAKKGQTASLSRVWGKNCLLFYKDPAFANVKEGVTYAWSATRHQFAGAEPDKSIGPRGGMLARAGEYIDEHVMAADCAYFIETVVS